jgi:cytoskeleton protein RodZ
MSDHPRRGRTLAGIGITLQAARVGRGLTIEQAAADTRISARFLEALEGERFHELPAPVYVRGFLRSYANYLRIDAQPLLDGLRLGDTLIPGPDGFVSGPRQAPQRGSQSVRGGDPFRRPPLPAPPPRTLEPVLDHQEEQPDDRPVVGSRREGPPLILSEPAVGRLREPSSPPPRLPDPEPEPEFEAYQDENVFEPDEAAFHSPRVAGVLLERPDADREATGPTRVLVLIGGAVLVLLFALGAAALLTRGGGSNDSKAVSTTATAPATYSTVVAIGSPAGSPTPNASPSPSASPTASPSPTASVSPSPTTTATATSAPTQAVAAPTFAPTATPTPSPTPTTAPTPTPTLLVTPFVPTPTSVPLPLHPFGLTECVQNGDSCQSANGTIYVICAPNGWFVDVHEINGTFANTLNWPTLTFTRSSQIGSHPC